ncbi:32 kDa-cell wall symbiosis regulated acidic polypeptide precursor [Pisolithus thermaeus]|nr:32 kDa-cell wall symbiosis regulated acidic polypeptide precursor [Pisolithus croceorrhizus]KAI6140775.1 32 kDa-cell wall symbiosis regulated acidic polypeptide precursor [Pisolithus thermaeus]
MASAAVCVSIILIFLPGVGLQHQEDVRNSFELAARAADKQAVKDDNRAKWCNSFMTTLLNIHWFGQQTRLEEEVKGSVLQSLQVSDSERQLLSNALNALEHEPENERALKLFTESALEQVHEDAIPRLLFIGGGCYRGKFQLAICSEKDDVVSVTSFFLQFHADGEHYRGLPYPDGKAGVKTTVSSYFYGLNDGLYNKIRDRIKDKLEATGISKQMAISGLKCVR